MNERSPPEAQQELLRMVDKRVALWPKVLPWYRDQKLASRGTESVLNALVLANTDSSRGHLSPITRTALDDMWTLQRTEGPEAGSWPWIDFHNEPWEAADSVYYGATVAALAIGLAPDGYMQEPAIRSRVCQLKEYLQRYYADQPLLNRIELLWAAEALPDLMDSQMRAALLRELSAQQRADGGWSVATLMPTWKRKDGSAFSDVSDGYATGFISWVMEKSGVSTRDPRLHRSLAWLKSHQSRWDGRWRADSLNRQYRFWQMTRFMDDAATAFAVLALIGAHSDAPTGEGS
jgi:squalene-hopene/tetraprenyl-beta-curcumene cyclase